ncbi:hypothetical protein ABZ027_36290 [Streptomyces sp. NPDC006332]|uniref:hypothetical protein n=1 Tax=Streptomyces sp. NPDC006332 TaxID=3155456 RepID=UPI0033BEF6AF
MRTTGEAAAVMFAVCLLGLVGCSSGGDGRAAGPTGTADGRSTASASPSADSPSASEPASPSAAASASASTSGSRPSPVTGPEQKLVTLTVSGGFAGVRQEVILRGDGTVTADDKGKPAVHRTSAAQFAKLRTLLGDPALAEIPAFTIDRGAADKFQYALQFNGRTVITDRSTSQPALDRLIDALSAWLPNH